MKLKRELKFFDVFCIATGAMIGSGLFILPGLAHAQAGPGVIFSYLIAGIFAMTGMLSQAELVSAMPKSGGDYFYVARSMGPMMGTVDGMLTWLSMSLKSSFALVGMAAFTHIVLGTDSRLIGLGFCVLFVVINYIGVKEAGRFQRGLVIGLIALLVIYVFKGVMNINVKNLQPFVPNGMGSVLATSGFVFISYGGLIKVTSIAEEVKSPEKTVPMGMIASLITVSVLYTLVVFVTSGVLGAAQLDHSLTPISDGASVFFGEWGRIALGVAAILAFVSTANAGIMSASRYPLALSRDRLLPDIFARISRRFKTPDIAIVTTGLIMIGAIFLNLNMLVKVASTVLLLTFIFSCLCVIIMRESRIQNYQPKFKSPLYPWIQIIGIFGSWLLIVNMGKEALMSVSVLFILGFCVFWFYGKQRARKDFALLHLIERVAAREFIDVSLEQELREIIRERDDIVIDRFDKLIEDAAVLDIEKSISFKDFFKLASEKMSADLKTDASKIFTLLLDREEESSTVLSPGLAIPHIIVEGEGTFMILLARCTEGVIFPGKDRKVHMIFVIAGTRDERNFHLRALSAIAQIVENPKFEKKWMAAVNKEKLREIVLLSQRKRH